MKAVIVEKYGGPEVLQIGDDLPLPRVGPNGVLVQVYAASVNPVDWKLRQGLLDAVMPVVFPVIWGRDLSGVVTEIGPSVTLFKPGDEVYGMKDGYVAKTYRGTYAEYVVVPEKSLAPKPKNLSYEEASAVPASALTAWQAMVNQGKLKPGQRVLIHAGAGGVGVMAIQIAKAFGAYVAATASTRNQDFLRDLGADLPIDYTREKIGDIRPKFDLVLDGVGKSVWADSFRALKSGGRLVTLNIPIPDKPTAKLKFFATAILGLAGGVARGLPGGKHLLVTRVKPRGGELEKISALIEAGKIRPVVEKVFPLQQIAEAHRLSEAGHVRGKLVIRIHDA
ncbi:MAG TPA: NADP-dependent oxidoreductase [Candidatus Angelobacter sp.]|jgi:NADPH:quinone reductase-like Zn-dependent oxidoreductase|nr:NADP-dependent oxidoreductase [Candidatus Angelobacter sp.]